MHIEVAGRDKRGSFIVSVLQGGVEIRRACKSGRGGTDGGNQLEKRARALRCEYEMIEGAKAEVR